MTASPVPTDPSLHGTLGTPNGQQNKGCSERSGCSDPKSQGWGRNNISLSALAVRWRADLDHDAAEAEAMLAFYAAPAGPELPESDPMAEGLLRGFWAHRRGAMA